MEIAKYDLDREIINILTIKMEINQMIDSINDSYDLLTLFAYQCPISCLIPKKIIKYSF
jgi:hypothetical protein